MESFLPIRLGTVDGQNFKLGKDSIMVGWPQGAPVGQLSRAIEHDAAGEDRGCRLPAIQEQDEIHAP